MTAAVPDALGYAEAELDARERESALMREAGTCSVCARFSPCECGCGWGVCVEEERRARRCPTCKTRSATVDAVSWEWACGSDPARECPRFVPMPGFWEALSHG